MKYASSAAEINNKTDISLRKVIVPLPWQKCLVSNMAQMFSFTDEVHIIDSKAGTFKFKLVRIHLHTASMHVECVQATPFVYWIMIPFDYW